MFSVSMDPIGLGTYRLNRQTKSTCLMALEIGYRTIDTAALYNNEHEVMMAVEESSIPREQIFITSKIPLKAIRSGCIKDAAKKSLDHLGAIDLLLLHAPGPNLRSDWDEMQEINSWTGIGDIGVSNFNIHHLEQLSHNHPKWNQIETSPFLQRRELVSYCEKHGIRIVAHSPLVKGEKMNCSRLLTISHKYGYTPSQLLLAWSLNNGYAAIPRSVQIKYLQENLEAKYISLSSEIIQELNRLESSYATHPQHQ